MALKTTQKLDQEALLSTRDTLRYFNKIKQWIGWDLPTRDKLNWSIYY